MARPRKIPVKVSMAPYFEVMDEVRKVVPQDAGVSSLVIYEEESCEDRTKRQMDPRMNRMKDILRDGTIIKVSSIGTTFNLSDPADIESIQNVQNEKVLNFLETNQEILKEKVNSKK